MITALDAGGVTALAGDRELQLEIAGRGQWPPHVLTVVLTECLTGDHRRDHATNRLLGTCVIRDVNAQLARTAARLRTSTGRAGSIAVVDALVAAYATSWVGAVVLTSDPGDLRTLSVHSDAPFTVAPV